MTISASGSKNSGPITIETLAEEDVQKTTQREALHFLEKARMDAVRNRRRAAQEVEPPPTPWDLPTEGLPNAFFATVWSALSAPKRFFSDLAPRPLAPALTFLLLCTLPAAVVQSFTADMWLGPALPPVRLLALASVITIPLGFLYLVSVYHAGATLLSQRRLKASTVARATAYGFAPMLFGLVPGVGIVIGLLWTVLLHYHALRRHLGLRQWQAVAVLAMPILPMLAATGIERLFV